jgi:hypothetical protein
MNTLSRKLFFLFSTVLLTFAAAPRVSAQWVQTNGPFGGAAVSCYATHDSVLFAGTDGIGVFRSTDSGVSWESTPLLDIINAIEVFGQDVFAATAFDEVYRSSDDGISWTRLDSGVYGANYLASSAQYLFAWSDGNLYRSSDNGASWTSGDSGIVYEVKSLVADSNSVFVGTASGIFKSTDAGLHFSQIYIAPMTGGINSVVVSGSNLFAGTSSGIIISYDGGSTWQAAGLDTLSIEGVAVSAGGTLFAQTDSKGIFVSSYSDTTWTAIDVGLSDSNLSTIAIDGSNVFAGTSDGGGPFRSTDGGAHWVSDDSGLTNYMVQSLAVCGSNLFATTWLGDIRSSDNGGSWIFDSVLSNYDASLAVNGENILGICPQGVIASSNAGSSWKVLDTVGPPGNGLTFPDPVAVSGAYFFVGTGAGVSYSTDSGGSWNQISSYLPVGGIYCLLASNSTIFAGGGIGVYRMTNMATDFNAIGELSNTYGVLSLAGTESNLFIGADDLGGVYRLKNQGSLATPIGHLNRTIYSLLVNNTNLFVGTDSGVYFSGNNGANWISTSAGLNDTNILSLAVQDSFLFAGTLNLGVWRIPLSEIVWPYTLSSSYDSLDFGNVFVDKDSSVTVSIKNTGIVDLTIASFAFSSKNSAFTYDTLSLPLTIQPGDSQSIEIKFKPIVAGVQHDTLLVLSEATELDIPLVGDGIGSAGVVENMSLSPSLHVFPNPASGNLQILGVQSGEIHLFDLMGRERMNAVWDGGNTTLDVSSLEPGMYFLREGNESAKVEISR